MTVKIWLVNLTHTGVHKRSIMDNYRGIEACRTISIKGCTTKLHAVHCYTFKVEYYLNFYKAYPCSNSIGIQLSFPFNYRVIYLVDIL